MSDFMFSALSERGMRTRNDDAYCAEKIGDYFVFALAAGLAGHPYGDIASMTVIEALRSAIKNIAGPPQQVLMTAVRKAEEEIRILSLRSPEYTAFSTKLVACLADKQGVFTVLDIGEGNCRIISENSIENARNIARARHPPGFHEDPQPQSLSSMVSFVLGDLHRIRNEDLSEFILGNDYLLLSSDGLTDVLKKDETAAIVRKLGEDPDAACEMLVQEAMKAGSERTITVILVREKQ